jgi:hypothetical protein
MLPVFAEIHATPATCLEVVAELQHSDFACCDRNSVPTRGYWRLMDCDFDRC